MRLELESAFTAIITKFAGVSGRLTADPKEMMGYGSLVTVLVSAFFTLVPEKKFKVFFYLAK